MSVDARTPDLSTDDPVTAARGPIDAHQHGGSGAPRRARGRGGAGGPGPLTHVLLVVVVLASVFPFYWMFVVASNDTSAMSQLPPRLVPGPNFVANARAVFEQIPFVQSLVNSFVVAGSITASVLFFCTLAGFAFAKLRFRGRGALFVGVVATMMVPIQLGIIPLFMIVSNLGWANELKAVVVPMMVTAFGVFWMRQYIDEAVPDDLLDAATVDGATTFQQFWRVVVPLVRPAMGVLGLLTFMQAWNDFFWPLVVLSTPDKHTVQIALQGLNSAYYQDYGMVMAGTFLGQLPVIAIFVLFGRQIVGGIMEGAVKG